MVGKLVGDDLRVNAETVITAGNRCGQPAGFFTGRNLCDGFFALGTGPLVTMNLPDEQLRWHQINSLADVGSDDRHLVSATGTDAFLERNVCLDHFASQVSRYFLGLLLTTPTFLWLRALVARLVIALR